MTLGRSLGGKENNLIQSTVQQFFERGGREEFRGSEMLLNKCLKEQRSEEHR
jgi:hypothetical protein